MMKKLMTIALCVSFLVCGCKGKTQSSEPVSSAVPASTEVASVPNEQQVRNFVKDMYEKIAQIVQSENFPQNTDFNKMFGSADWNATVKAVNEHDAQLDEMGFFEADPWVMGQDAGDLEATDLDVERTDDSSASVVLNLHNLGSVTRVRLLLVKDAGNWRVDDLVDLTHGFDWKAEMKAYLKP